MSGEKTPALVWKKSGSEVGLLIWRIEKFDVVPVPKDTYGSFYSGDSYIILNTYKRPGSDALQWDIHFWLGKESSQDEMGTAAYKTVELDEYLGGGPVQHREVQGFESKLFQGYFPKGIRIMAGGIDSGFNHVKPAEYKPRLLQLKGKRHVRLVEVPLTKDSVNSGDVFVLDMGLTLYQFNGNKSAPGERRKAAEVCKSIQDERLGKGKTVVFEECDPVADYPEDWQKLVGLPPYKTAEEGGDDAAFEKESTSKVLFRLSDASGSLEFTKVAENADVTRDKLDGDDVFIVDTGIEIFTWIGKGTTAQERKNGMKYAIDYLAKSGKNPATPITMVMEGYESSYFFSAFAK